MTVTSIATAGQGTRTTFRPATFGDVLRSEWTKLALRPVDVLGPDRQPWSWASASGQPSAPRPPTATPRSSVSDKLSWDPASVSTSGLAIAQLAIAVLGVLYISSEYSTGMIRTSLTAVPKRGRVLAAKSLVYAAVTFIVGEVISFVAFFLGQALINGHAPRAALGDPGVARAVVGAGLYLTALAILAVAVGTLLRHSAAAITCMVAVLFVLPGIAQALPDSWRHPVTEFWPTQAGSQLDERLPLRPHPPALARLRRHVPVRCHRVRHRLDVAGPPGRVTAVRRVNITSDSLRPKGAVGRPFPGKEKPHARRFLPSTGDAVRRGQR